MQGSVLEPKPIPPVAGAEQVVGLTVPEGFTVSVFARDLVNPRMLEFSRDGTLYATRRSVGDVVMLRDMDGNGQADEIRTVASRSGMHGIAFDGDTVFLVTVKEVYTAEVGEDDGFGPLRKIIADLPDGGQHPNQTLGIDWLGDNEQIEELNHLEQGKNYGGPFIYGMGEVNPRDNPPEGLTLEKLAEKSMKPAMGYTPHSAPMQMAFYDGAAFRRNTGATPSSRCADRGTAGRRPARRWRG